MCGIALCWTLSGVASSSPGGLASADESPSESEDAVTALVPIADTSPVWLPEPRESPDHRRETNDLLQSPDAIGSTADRDASATSPTSTVVAPVVDRDSIGGQALAAMRFDWPAIFDDWTIEFHDERMGLRALTYPHEKRIEVFVRERDTVRSLHRVLAHEFGHVVDVELNTAADRDRWVAERALAPNVLWWPDESAADFGTGAGDFAEAFAVWETGIRTQSTVGGQPDSDDMALLAELAGR